MKGTAKKLAIAIPLVFGLYSSFSSAADLDLGILSAGNTGPIYELETAVFNDKYSFGINFGSIPTANINIQFDDLLVGSHSIPDLTAELFNALDVSLGVLSGNNAPNNFLLGNGNYYLQVAGTPQPLNDPNGATFGLHFNVTPVPEPETYALMLGGLALIGFSARRRKS